MKIPLLDSLAPKRRRQLFWSLGLLLFYTLFGFLILPLIVRAVAVKQLSRQFEREVTIASVKLNPYTFSATIRGLLVKDKDGRPFISWDEVYANLQLSSFLGHPWVFREIQATKPYLRLQMNKDFTLNCSDLIDKFNSPNTNTPSKPTRPLAMRIGQFRVAGARISLTDLTPRTPFTRELGPVELTLSQFRTEPAHSNAYACVGTADSGEKFGAKGHFFLDPLRLEGEFSLENLALNKFAPLYQDLVRFTLEDGRVALQTAYQFSQSTSHPLAIVTNFNFQLHSLKISESGTTNSFAELGELAIAGLSIDALAHRAEIGAIDSGHGRVWLRRDTNANINLLEAARPREEGAPVAGGVQLVLRSLTNFVAQVLASTNAWEGTLHAVHARHHQVHLEDDAHLRPARLTLDKISLQATNFSNRPDQTLTAISSVRWNTNGTILASSSVKLFPLRAEVSLNLDRLELAPLGPFLEPFMDVLVNAGTASLHGRATLTHRPDQLPEAQFHGDAAVDDLVTLDSEFGDELLTWKALRVSGLQAQLEPLGAAIGEIELVEPRTRIIINTNRHINLLSAARLQELNPLLHDTNAPSPRAERKTGQPAAAAQASGPSTNPPAVTRLPKISVATVALTNADLQFTDRSLKPFVNVAFAQLTGRVTGLSTEPGQRAELSLTGRVDNTALAEISGQIHPLSQKEATDVTVKIKDIDLLPTGPYSGKFLGYRLHKGKLSFDVRYQVNEGKLKASNLIVIDQLTLGEKTGSPEATKLPVRLAVAVLKDRNGRIELDVPIAGTLDDPEFKLGRVISHTIVNMITKIATSPFAALGALFGGKGEEIQFQEFAAGASELQPPAREKLDLLLKGLYERPGLQLEIEGSIDPAADRAALARQKIEEEIRARKWKSLRKAEQSRTRPEDLVLTPEEYQDKVKELHAAAFKPEAMAARAAKKTASTNSSANINGTNVMVTGSTNPPPETTRSSAATAPARLGEKGASALLLKENPAASAAQAKLSPSDLEGQLFETIEVTENDYAALASARAQRVKEYLLQSGQIESERLFLTEATSTNGTRVYLHLR